MKRRRELTLEEFDSRPLEPLTDDTNQLQGAQANRRKVKSKRSEENTSKENIAKSKQQKCCPSNCIEKISDDVFYTLRLRFWNLVIAEPNNEIINHCSVVSEEKCVVSGILVCSECWRIIHGVSRSRYIEKKYSALMVADGRKGMKYGKQRNAELVNFLTSLSAQGEKLPDKNRTMLPTCMTQQNAYEEYAQTHENPFHFRHFQRVWKGHFPNMRASEKSLFTECKECSMFRQLKSSKLDKSQYLRLEKQKKAHLLMARIAREKYYKHCKKAMDQKEKYLSLIIDNMDQAKTNLPRFPSYHKGGAALTRVHHHVTGVLAHGQRKAYAFTWTDKFTCDSNITINCLLKVLEDVSREKSLPRNLYIQADNSAKDNKNYILMGFLANLVQRNIFKKIKLSFLMVGHTHEDVDQMFSRVSVHLANEAVPTLPRLHKLVEEAYHPQPIVHHLDNLWDYRDLGVQGRVHLTGHSSPHLFRFVKKGGNVEMGYKTWPLQSEIYQTVDVTSLAGPFNVEPSPLLSINDKGERTFGALEEDLRKWLAGGKLTEEDVLWWRSHLKRERHMPPPTIPKSSSFKHYWNPPAETCHHPAMDILEDHIRNFQRSSMVKVTKRRH